jgi:glutathione peroxidase
VASLFDFKLDGLQGGSIDFAAHKPKAVLLVNVASKCGYTPQYKGLEAMWRANKLRGLLIVGTPCNQFLSQEPGDAGQIASFCSREYGVSFPLSAKLDVNGPNRHPLYAWLLGPMSKFQGNVGWNFEKFLFDRDGNPVARFPSKTAPDSPEVLTQVADLL